MQVQRINAIEPPYTDDVQRDFDRIMPPGMPPLNIFRTVANNPRVLSRMIAGGLLDRGSISIAERELVILRTCAVCGAEYEWGVHVSGFGHKTGMSRAQISDTVSPKPDPALWEDRLLMLMEMVDQLHGDSTIDDELWKRLAARYAEDQIVELVMLAGLYHAVSFIVNALVIEKEEFAPSFTG